MLKHTFYVSILACFLCSSLMAQDAPKVEKHSKKVEGNFVHTVYFWLHNPDNLKERKKFEEGVSKLLQECKSITASHIGIPADTAIRPVVDDTYTYCIVVTFESKKEHDAYQIDPIHKKFIEENGNLWKKVQVYDSVSF